MVELDSQALTHVAAILVGVLVTLVLVGGFSSSNKKTAAAAPAGAASSTGDASAAGGQSKNQKKKKKKKGKGGAAATSEGETVAAEEKPKEKPKSSPKDTPKVAAKAAAPKEDEKKDDADDDDDDDDEVDLTALKPANGKKKKKKPAKKSGANGNAAATNGNKGGEKATNGGATNGSNSNGSSKKENQARAANTASAHVVMEPPPPPQEEPIFDDWQPLPATAPKEEEWNDVVEPKKKRKNRVKAPKPVAAPVAAVAPTSNTESVSVDAKKIGIIIGPKGATMQAIQEATGCSLDINAPAKDEKVAAPTAGVVITGPDKESCTKAKKAIQELATKGYATLLQGDGFGEFAIQVHPRYLSEIVGPGGKCIQALQSTLDVKITIPPTDWKPNQVQVGKIKMCNVGIAGSKENSKLCKQAIRSLIDYHHHEITHPGFIHEEVFVPQEFFHCVIGPRGSEIKHIRGNYKVDVYMPNAESVTENVVVVGKQTNVDKAISYIQLLMDRDSEQREKKYSDEYYG